MKKYRLLREDSILYNGRTLYRIESLKDFNGVHKGDLGGFVESEDNLSHDYGVYLGFDGYKDLRVSPAMNPPANAICLCSKPNNAEWIAQRLNLASKLEQMTYDYATGKTDGDEIVKYVHECIN